MAGGYLVRHGKKHDIWEVNGMKIEIPRHEGRDLSKKVRDDIKKALDRQAWEGDDGIDDSGI